MTTSFPTGNALRDQAIIAVILEAQMQHEPLTWANVALKCDRFGPTFGDLTEDEFKEACSHISASAPPEPLPAEDGGPAEHSDQQAPTMPAAEVSEAIRINDNELALARSALRDAQTNQKATRADLSRAILAWQTGGRAPLTREQLVRETIAANQQEKLDRKEGRVPPRPERRVANSYMDRVGSMGHGDANDFARKQMNTGHRRGSFPASARGRQVRLPSEG